MYINLFLMHAATVVKLPESREPVMFIKSAQWILAPGPSQSTSQMLTATLLLIYF